MELGCQRLIIQTLSFVPGYSPDIFIDRTLQSRSDLYPSFPRRNPLPFRRALSIRRARRGDSPLPDPKDAARGFPLVLLISENRNIVRRPRRLIVFCSLNPDADSADRILEPHAVLLGRRRQSNRDRVIMKVLPEIPTENLTEKNVDELCKKTF